MASGALRSIDVIFMYLSDGHVLYIEDFKGNRPDSGDILYVSRTTGRVTEEVEDLAVVLGCGGTNEETVAKSKQYIRRVAECHGDSNDLENEVSMSLFGFDLSQSEVLM